MGSALTLTRAGIPAGIARPALRTFYAVGILACIAVPLAGCGGVVNPSGQTGSVPGQNTSVTVLATSSANDQLSQFNIQITRVTLTSQSGSTVNLMPSTVNPEFIHLNGPAEPVAIVSVPQGVYTSVAVTLGSAQFVCVTQDAAAKQLDTSTFEADQVPASAVTVDLASPITVSGTSMGLLLNLDVSNSASWATCNDTGATIPFSVTPVFDVSPVTIAAQPTNSGNGKVTGMYGMISSVNAIGNALTVLSAEGTGGFGPTWQASVSSATAYEGVGGFTQLAAGMPVDMDVVIQQDGSLVATRVAVYDTDTTELSVFTGPIETVWDSTPVIGMENEEQQGYLNQQYYYGGASSFDFTGAAFQASGSLSNVQVLPFTASFNAANMIAGQRVSVTTHVSSLEDASSPPPVATVTLLPQTLDGTVSGIGSEGGFTTYAITLAPYDLFPNLAVQPGQTTLLTNPNTVVVYADSDTQMLNTQPIAVGSVVRFYGLVFNDSGTLRMDCAQVNDGVPE